MIQPSALQPGDVVGIVAPGRKIDSDAVTSSIGILESWGFRAILGKNIFSEKHSYLSGTDAERLQDFQQMLDDPTIKAILCARGGYGTTRILDQLDFTAFLKNPKWICGFSDITALHLKLQSLCVQSIHATMPVLFPNPDSKSSLESLRTILSEQANNIEATPFVLNKGGEAKGEVIGGNLSLIVDSLGTDSEIITANKILVIEEIDEYLYKIDRMLVQLKRAGKLQKLAGLVVGHMTEIKDTELSFGESVQELILNQLQEFTYPIGFNFPIGHAEPNQAFVEGKIYSLQVQPEGSVLETASH